MRNGRLAISSNILNAFHNVSHYFILQFEAKVKPRITSLLLLEDANRKGCIKQVSFQPM